ncbi:MAG: L-fucose:H+ symporter permease [Bacteroidetes bacterium]|nr:MAG: L-fucose:H+ symporter permease [Bacteroidota bacterium]
MSQTLTVKKQNVRFAFILVVSLFFLWALTSNLLGTLIPHLKKTCQLDILQSSFIDFAYWIGYFVTAIPAAMIMRKYSYKTGIICGLIIAGIGAAGFYPAAEVRQFGLFLAALFIMACGMAFLETAANPFITILGPAESSSQRLNFAQAFNGLGAFISTFFISDMILSGIDYTPEQLNKMSPAELESYLHSEASRLQIPYLVIASILLVVAILFYVVKMPPVPEEKDSSFHIDTSVFKHKHFRLGVIAQFFYVGAQVCISSFFIPFAKYSTHLSEQTIKDNHYLGYLLLCFAAGRYVGTFLMMKMKIKPERLLTFFAICNILLLAYCIFFGGHIGLFSMMGVEFFMSIMFPTIFALGIKNLGTQTKIGSSFMVMSIVGGALIPLVFGYISRQLNVQVGYVVPLICFVYVGYYGWRGYVIQEKSTSEMQVAV